MSQINFLPQSFHRDRRRQQRRPIEFMIILATALMLVVLWIYTSGPDRAIAQQAQAIDQQMLRIEQQQAEHSRLDQERAKLTGQLLIARETYQPILTTQVLARLSQLTPQPIRLINFELVAERPKPEPPAKSAGPGNRKAGSSKTQKQPTQARENNRMKLALTGLAPTDDEIVAFIRQLEQDPVFSSVSLSNSRMTQTKTHLAREFRLDLEIDLDRRFVTTGPGGGDSDAD